MINFKQLPLFQANLKISFGILFFSFLTAACSDKVNVTELCDNNVEFCDQIRADNWCKAERISLLVNHDRVKNNNRDDDKYKLLITYEGYIKCMSLAAQIQHIKLKEKTTKRINNLNNAQANFAQLSTEVAHSNHPHILYYLWSRNTNEQALAELLVLEGTEALNNSTSQYHLATYYVKRDRKKTLGLLYRALELHEPDTTLNPEILETLATIFTNKKQYKQAYIWLRAYQLLLEKPNKMLEQSLKSYQVVGDLNTEFLDDVASSTLDKILAGKFTSPNY
ncbi:DUF2989 domain-containing protein [Colwellia echini]|uniref:DUF2989 domain-containing protein n=1 Tax=Colwellia echini TaxID=1982103 RepID=A0ABY3N024_9GAMM|nr:DUF2989 domain-containing protein [Colwellia echini]TYK66846.1 DUF2989 domain-containing protein [Colwellia echini]